MSVWRLYVPAGFGLRPLALHFAPPPPAFDFASTVHCKRTPSTAACIPALLAQAEIFKFQMPVFSVTAGRLNGNQLPPSEARRAEARVRTMSFDPHVMHNAESWSDGIKKYKAEKSRC